MPPIPFRGNPMGLNLYEYTTNGLVILIDSTRESPGENLTQLTNWVDGSKITFDLPFDIINESNGTPFINARTTAPSTALLNFNGDYNHHVEVCADWIGQRCFAVTPWGKPSAEVAGRNVFCSITSGFMVRNRKGMSTSSREQPDITRTYNKTGLITAAANIADDGEPVVYKDGALIAPGTIAPTLYSQGYPENSLTIMKAADSYCAKIMSVRIYNRPLTPEEVAHNYKVDMRRRLRVIM